MKIGQKIKKIRELRNYTQIYIADKLGISQNAYSKIERDETDVSFSRLNQISQVLDINILDLIGFDDNKLFFNNTTGNGIAFYNAGTIDEKDIYEKYIKKIEQDINQLKLYLSKIAR